MVGRQLLRQAAGSGIAVSGCSRGRPGFLPSGASWSPWDLNDWRSDEEFDALFPGVQAVIHAGARVPLPGENVPERALYDANVRAAFNAGAWAIKRGVWFVHLSGGIVYRDPNKAPLVESDPTGANAPGGAYGASKLLAESTLSILAQQGLKLIILRPSSIYGEGLHESKMLSQFMLRARRGQPLAVAAPADDSFDPVHSADVAKAALQALSAEAAGVFNVGGGRAVTIREAAEACVLAAGRGQVESSEPGGRAGRPRVVLDCTAARRAFGYAPAVGLIDGLKSLGA